MVLDMEDNTKERIRVIKDKLNLIPEIHEEIERYYIYYKEDIRFLLELLEVRDNEQKRIL
jgi:hypothetical protein